MTSAEQMERDTRSHFQPSNTIKNQENIMDQNHLSALRGKHEALDRQISEEEARPVPDTIRLHDLKKQKLRLKEELLTDA
jgi:hypothetical protein